MKKQINIYFKLLFTSNSPDAQVISLGMVSDDIYYQNDCIKVIDDIMDRSAKRIKTKPQEEYLKEFAKPKSFYAELNDFDLNRCDEFVKENVVGKLMFYNSLESHEDFRKAFEKTGKEKVVKHISGGHSFLNYLNEDEKSDEKNLLDNNPLIYAGKHGAKEALSLWLSQFKDYNITFIGDKCSWEWVKLVELIGEWKELELCPKCKEGDHIASTTEMKTGYPFRGCLNCGEDAVYFKIGNPILPENISPEPMDLNTVIALKEGISIKEAMSGIYRDGFLASLSPHAIGEEIRCGQNERGNSIWDAEVIKEIYQKLIK